MTKKPSKKEAEAKVCPDCGGVFGVSGGCSNRANPFYKSSSGAPKWCIDCGVPYGTRHHTGCSAVPAVAVPASDTP